MKGLREKDLKILQAITSLDRNADRKRIAKECNLSLENTRKYLRKLSQKGYIEAINLGIFKTYSITTKGNTSVSHLLPKTVHPPAQKF